MTIALSLKVNDGIVIASDSATSLMVYNPDGNLRVQYIYENSNKIFNLYKGLPIGAISWGAGSIGQASTSTLAKDFRERITQCIDRDDYTIEEIANHFKSFIYNENYLDAFKEWREKPNMGFMVVGYSAKRPLAEEWKIDIDKNGNCHGPYQVRQEHEVGCTWNGEPEAITRIFTGVSPGMASVLKECGIEEKKIQEIINASSEKLTVPFVTPAMPIQDAINLAEFFVDTTIKFSLYEPGPSTVGGPIEIAAITKHEGFKWVKRKHYFEQSLNP